MVLVPGEALLFFKRHSFKEGLLYNNTLDIEFSLSCPVSWARRTVQVEVTVTAMQEGCRTIADTVMEKTMKARGPWHPQGLRGDTQSLAAACNIDDWMPGLDEGVSEKKVVGRTDDIHSHNDESGHAHTWCTEGDKWQR